MLQFIEQSRSFQIIQKDLCEISYVLGFPFIFLSSNMSYNRID